MFEKNFYSLCIEHALLFFDSIFFRFNVKGLQSRKISKVLTFLHVQFVHFSGSDHWSGANFLLIHVKKMPNRDLKC